MLGMSNSSQATRNIPEAQKALHFFHTPGGRQQLAIISEPGLYRLSVRSNKPEAEPFISWITGEVLPTIRKTGGVYLSPEKAEDLICNPDLIIGLAALVLSFQFESWVCLALFFMRRKIPARVAHQALPQGLPPGAFQRNERQQGVRSACSFF